MEERERACDEEVLQLGNPPQVYAESILKTCEFSVGSPLACISGVTGADLKKRIVDIMQKPVALKLDRGKKLLLIVAGAMAAAGPVVFGLIQEPQIQAGSPVVGTASKVPAYEVASIKPDKSGTDMTTASHHARGVQCKQYLVEGAYSTGLWSRRQSDLRSTQLARFCTIRYRGESEQLGRRCVAQS